MTELSLNVLQTGFYYNFETSEPEANPGIITQIDGWVAEFIQALKALE